MNKVRCASVKEEVKESIEEEVEEAGWSRIKEIEIKSEKKKMKKEADSGG